MQCVVSLRLIFVHGFREGYAVYAVLAKNKKFTHRHANFFVDEASTFGVLFFLWSLHASMQIFVAKKNRARQLEQMRASSRIFQDCSPRLPYDVSLRFFSAAEGGGAGSFSSRLALAPMNRSRPIQKACRRPRMRTMLGLLKSTG